MIKAEIIALSPQAVSVAFYYPVPPHMHSTASRDPSRVPAGAGMTASEIQELKDGTLYEIVRDIDPESMSKAQMRDKVEQSWADFKDEAKDEYLQKFSYMNLPGVVGKKWDETGWS